MPGFLLGSILPIEARRRNHLWILISTLILFAGLFVFFNVGRWLVAEDPLQKATAIAVLSGKMPGRALEAARIYREGYASEIWLTHSTEPGASLEALSVPFTGEESYERLILMRKGVPETAIRVLDPPIVNTADEMVTIGQALGKESQHTVIIVTSKVHTRRVKALWKHLSSAEGEAIVRGVSDDGFDPAHWWGNTSDALDVVREALGLLNAWAGLPVQPAR
jgi:uncharacterized SAM-binding protein YcdF (DUF218 family)